MSTLLVNPDAQVSFVSIDESHQCAIVDDFLVEPGPVRDFAMQIRDQFVMPERSYPGLTVDVSAASMGDIYRFLRRRMSREFSFLRGDIDFSSMLAITSLQPQELSNHQRICHTDPRREAGRVNYASVLYLFDSGDLGGTAFYRWRDRSLIEEATRLDLDDPVKALGYLQEHSAYFREPPCYMTGSNDIAERLTTIPAKFNRLLFYSGDVPHSACIENPGLLSDDPGTGRLTLNSFASALPAYR